MKIVEQHGNVFGVLLSSRELATILLVIGPINIPTLEKRREAFLQEVSGVPKTAHKAYLAKAYDFSSIRLEDNVPTSSDSEQAIQEIYDTLVDYAKKAGK